MKKATRACIVCGAIFTLPKYNKGRAKYCSKKCRQKQTNKNWNDYRTRKAKEKRDKEAEKPSDLKIQCQICGRWYRQVGSHIVQRHKMLAREYREKYGFDVKKGQLPDDLRALYGKQALENGTVKNVIEGGKKYRFKKKQKGIGIYKRSEQTMKRLKRQGKKIRGKKI